MNIQSNETKTLVKQDIQDLSRKYSLEKEYVLTCFNDVKDPEEKAKLTEKLITMVDVFTSQGKQVLMASFQHADIYIRDDYRLNQYIQSRAKHPDRIQVIGEMLDPFTTIELMRRSHFLLAERLHSMVLANLAEADFFGISYQRKCTAFLEQIGHQNFVELDMLIKMNEAEIKELF